MREILFDPEFWPTMNTKLQTDLAKDLHQGATFWENFALALSMLAAYDTDMLRADYNKFPAAPSSFPANGFNRFLSLSTFGSDSMGPDPLSSGRGGQQSQDHQRHWITLSLNRFTTLRNL